jgi:hypothetical protein
VCSSDLGSGKTHAGALESLRMPTGSIGTVIAPTYPMLRDGAMRTILQVAGAGNIIQEFNQSHGELKLIGNRTILFRSADNADRLRFYAHKQIARVEFHNAKILLRHQFDKIDWEIVQRALTHVPKMFQIFACKQVFDMAGTNYWLCRYTSR